MGFRSVREFLELKGADAPTPAERRVIAAVQAGEKCVLSTKRPAAPTPDNTVRAGLLRLLITGATPDCGTQDFGVWVEGVWITGELDLGFAKARGRTVLHACHFAAAPQFPEADLNLLSLDGSHLPGLFAQGMRLRGDLFLRNVTGAGTVDVAGAKVGGKMACTGATFDGPIVDDKRGKALNAQGVETGQHLFLRKVKVKGTVELDGAKIGGQMACEGATFDGAGGLALYAQGVEIGESLSLSGVKATGTVSVNRAKVGGHMNCTGATFDGPIVDDKRGKALNAQGVETGQSLFLRQLTATGTVVVNGAKIGGQIDCDGASFDGAGTLALDAQGAEAGLDLFLRRVTATGTVDVNGAKVGGQMECTGATFDGPLVDGKRVTALIAQRLHVAKGLFWRNVTVKGGAVMLSAAQVGDLVDDGRWPCGVNALDLDGFTYDRIVGNTAPLTASERRAWLRAGSVWNGRFRPQPYTQLARVFRSMGHGGEARRVLIAGREMASHVAAAFQAARRRVLADLHALLDQPDEARWQRFSAQVSAAPPDVQTEATALLDRLELIGRDAMQKRDGQPDLSPDTLDWARRGYMGEIRQRIWASRLQSAVATIWDRTLRWLVGYGHAPERSLYALAVLLAIGWFVADTTWREGQFAPNSDVILTSEGWAKALGVDCKVQSGEVVAADCRRNPAEDWSNDPARGMDWESFNAFSYALDLVVPVLDLGQTDAWAPSKDRGDWGFTLWWLRWVLATLGWVFSLFGAAAFTGIMQKDRE